MKRILIAIIFLLGAAFRANAQSTTVSGTVTDTGAQTWNGGSYSFQLIANPNFPNLASYTWTGGDLTQTIRGSLDGAGAYSQSLPSNSAISPQGSKWVLIACPLATSSCASSANTTITGGAQTLNLTPPVIAINLQSPDQFVRAYADSEIITAFIGAQYYNLTSGMMRDCQTVSGQTCTVWANVGAGAGGTVTSVSGVSPIVATPNPITGVGTISCPTCAIGTTPTPGGANTNVQFNDAGAFGGDAGLTYNKATKSFVATGGASSDSFMSAIGAGGGLNFVEVLAAGTNIAAQGTNAPVDIFASGDVSLVPGAGKSVLVGAQGTVSGVHKYFGTTSGSASFGVADIAGTPARINLPIATGTNGLFLKTDGGTPQQTSWSAVSSATTPFTISSAGNGNAVLALSGNTSGTATFTAPAVAGTSTNPVTISNVFQGPNGLVTAPTYGFTVNSGTGMYSDGAGNLKFAQVGATIITVTGGAVVLSGNTSVTAALTANTYLTGTNCSSAASPAVCGSAAAGSFVIAAAGTTVTVNTSAVTANSQIFVQQDDSLGTKLGVTCNTGFLTAPPAITARTAATSFVVTLAAGLAVNPVCFSYHIIN